MKMDAIRACRPHHSAWDQPWQPAQHDHKLDHPLRLSLTLKLCLAWVTTCAQSPHVTPGTT